MINKRISKINVNEKSWFYFECSLISFFLPPRSIEQWLLILHTYIQHTQYTLIDVETSAYVSHSCTWFSVVKVWRVWVCDIMIILWNAPRAYRQAVILIVSFVVTFAFSVDVYSFGLSTLCHCFPLILINVSFLNKQMDMNTVSSIYYVTLSLEWIVNIYFFWNTRHILNKRTDHYTYIAAYSFFFFFFGWYW